MKHVFLGPNIGADDRMLRERNIRRRAHATSWRLVTLLRTLCVTLGITTPAPAQDDAVQIGDAVRAFLTVRGWVDQFTPPDPDQPRARVDIPNASGVCVILRRGGRVVGLATAGGGTLDPLDLRRATGRALSEVLADPAFALLPPGSRAEVISTLGPELTLELEIAGPPRPIVGTMYTQLAEQVAPGLEGIALRRGDDWTQRFPSQLRVTNASGRLAQMLPGMPSDLGVRLADLRRLPSDLGVSAYALPTVNLVQSAPRELPVVATRGDEVVSLLDVTPDAMARAADALAQHILDGRWVAPPPQAATKLGLRGGYEPHIDDYRPSVAPPLDQALCILGLVRYSRAPGVDEAMARTARAQASALLDELAVVERGEQAPDADAASCAAIFYAITELSGLTPGTGEQVRLLDTVVERLRGVRLEGGTMAWPGRGHEGATEIESPHDMALVAGALSRLRRLAPDDPDWRELARPMVELTWRATPEHQTIALLPWLGWAELDLAATEQGIVVEAARLLALREVLMGHLVGSPDRPGPLDEHGSMALGRGGATAQSLRPGVFFTSIIFDPSLTPVDRRDLERERVRRLVRFIFQLTVRPSASWRFQAPARALGGVRQALWDDRQPLPAQALALILLADALQAEERARQEAEKQAGEQPDGA